MKLDFISFTPEERISETLITLNFVGVIPGGADPATLTIIGYQFKMAEATP